MWSSRERSEMEIQIEKPAAGMECKLQRLDEDARGMNLDRPADCYGCHDFLNYIF